jgi:hypothetical protein
MILYVMSFSRVLRQALLRAVYQPLHSSVPYGSVDNMTCEKVRRDGRYKLSIPEIIACSSPKSNSWLPLSRTHCDISVVLLCLDQDIESCLYIYLGIKSLQSFHLGSAQESMIRGHQDNIIAHRP